MKLSEIACLLDEKLPGFWNLINGRYRKKLEYDVPNIGFLEQDFIKRYFINVYINAEFEVMFWISQISMFSRYYPKLFLEIALQSKSFKDFFIVCQQHNHNSFFEHNVNNKNINEVESFSKHKYCNYFYEGFNSESITIEQKEEEIIFKFLSEDENSLYSICDDFTLKLNCVYSAIMSNYPDKKYNNRLINDYVKLMNLVFQNKYIINGKVVELKDAGKYDSDNPFINMDNGRFIDRSVGTDYFADMFYNCISTRSLFILYNYWRLNPRDESRLKFYLQILLIHIKLICTDKTIDTFSYRKYDEIEKLLNFVEFREIKKKKIEDIVKSIISYVEEYLNNSENYMSLMYSDMQKCLAKYDGNIVSSILQKQFNVKDIILAKIADDEYRILYYKCDSHMGWSNFPGESFAFREIISDISYREMTISSWAGKFVTDLFIQGIDKEKFRNNDSFQVLINNKDIRDSKSSYLNNLPDDMDFYPYHKLTYESSIRSCLQKYCHKIYERLYYLGLCLEDIYLLNYVISFDCFYVLSDFEVDVLIAKIQKRIYGIRGSRVVKNEFRQMSIDSLEKRGVDLENDLYKRFFMYMNEIIKDVNTIEDYEKLIKKKQMIFDNMMNYGIDDEILACANDITDIVSEKALTIIKSANNYNNISCRVNNNFANLKNYLRGKAKILYGTYYTEQLYNDIMDKVCAYITTGEILYEIYVQESQKREQLVDYGCIAIEYYKALEYMVNNLLYKPYYLNFLKNRLPISKESEIGYAGTSFNNITRKVNGKYLYKESLEYGTLSIFLKNLILSDEWYKYCASYYHNNGINISKLVNFSSKMYDTKNLRNNCAHPEITEDIFVVKARGVTYKSESLFENKLSNIKLANNIYELIFEVITIFSE